MGIKYSVQPNHKKYTVNFEVDEDKVNEIINIFSMVSHIKRTYDFSMYTGFNFIVDDKINFYCDIGSDGVVRLTADQMVPDYYLGEVTENPSVLVVSNINDKVNCMFDKIIQVWKDDAMNLFRNNLLPH